MTESGWNNQQAHLSGQSVDHSGAESVRLAVTALLVAAVAPSCQPGSPLDHPLAAAVKRISICLWPWTTYRRYWELDRTDIEWGARSPSARVSSIRLALSEAEVSHVCHLQLHTWAHRTKAFQSQRILYGLHSDLPTIGT